VIPRTAADVVAALARTAPSNARPSWWRLLLRTGRHRPEVVQARLEGERARAAEVTQRIPAVADGPEPAYVEVGPS
jgi:hypothetical protein